MRAHAARTRRAHAARTRRARPEDTGAVEVVVLTPPIVACRRPVACTGDPPRPAPARRAARRVLRSAAPRAVLGRLRRHLRRHPAVATRLNPTILVGTGGVTWSDVSARTTPALWSLLRDGATRRALDPLGVPQHLPRRRLARPLGRQPRGRSRTGPGRVPPGQRPMPAHPHRGQWGRAGMGRLRGRRGRDQVRLPARHPGRDPGRQRPVRAGGGTRRRPRCRLPLRRSAEVCRVRRRPAHRPALAVPGHPGRRRLAARPGGCRTVRASGRSPVARRPAQGHRHADRPGPGRGAERFRRDGRQHGRRRPDPPARPGRREGPRLRVGHSRVDLHPADRSGPGPRSHGDAPGGWRGPGAPRARGRRAATRLRRGQLGRRRRLPAARPGRPGPGEPRGPRPRAALLLRPRGRPAGHLRHRPAPVAQRARLDGEPPPAAGDHASHCRRRVGRPGVDVPGEPAAVVAVLSADGLPRRRASPSSPRSSRPLPWWGPGPVG